MSRMKNSVRMTFAMIAPTKNPSSRFKITPQASQSCLRLNARLTIDAFPHTGHCSFKERQRTSPIVRASRFISSLYRAHRSPLRDVRAAKLHVMRLDYRRGERLEALLKKCKKPGNVRSCYASLLASKTFSYGIHPRLRKNCV